VCALYIITYLHVFEHSMCHACMRPCRLELNKTWCAKWMVMFWSLEGMKEKVVWEIKHHFVQWKGSVPILDEDRIFGFPNSTWQTNIPWNSETEWQCGNTRWDKSTARSQHRYTLERDAYMTSLLYASMCITLK